jgi:hypothetical protein
METSLELEVVQPSALEAINRAEVDIQVATAHRFPRSLAKFLKRATEMATLDAEVAESCIYKLKRKNEDGSQKIIEGESIRLAEIVAASYGNMRIAAQITEQTPTRVTVRAVAHDLETNVLFAQEKVAKTVKRNGEPYSEDMQVIAANALVSKATRDAIFRVIPKSMVKSIKEAAKKVAIGDSTTLTERRTKAMNWVKTLGIEISRVFATLGVKGEAEIGLEQLETLIGLHTAIKEGDLTPEQAFAVIGEEQPARGQSAEIKLPTRKKREPKAEEKAADTHPELQPEVPPQPKPQNDPESSVNSTFRVSMESSGVTLDDIKDIAAMKPALAPRSMEWNEWADISDDDCKFIIEGVSVENGTIKWKKR